MKKPAEAGLGLQLCNPVGLSYLGQLAGHIDTLRRAFKSAHQCREIKPVAGLEVDAAGVFQRQNDGRCSSAIGRRVSRDLLTACGVFHGVPPLRQVAYQ